MGDIADMMLEGYLCEGCGSYIDDAGGSGFPRYCSRACANMRGAEYHEPRAHRDPPSEHKLSKKIEAKINALGLTFHRHETYHRTVRRDGKVIADWWPHKKKFRLAGSRCQHGEERAFLIALSALSGN